MKINKGPGLFGAAVGISAVVTAGFGWLEVLLGWCFGAVLRALLPERKESGYNIICMCCLLVLGTVLLGGIVLTAEKAFPEDSTFPFVSVALLILLWRSLIGEKETGSMVSNVIGLVLLGTMGVILLFGFGNADWKETLPEGFSWRQACITVAVTSPWWAEPESAQKWGWFCAAAVTSVGMSLLCRGILGSALTEYRELPFYQAVQTIHILGTLQRFEALLASGVLLGTFNMLTQVGNVVRNVAEALMPNVSSRARAGIILLVAYGLENCYLWASEGIKTMLSTLFWGVVLAFALGVVFCGNLQKTKKVLDKMWSVE